MQQQDDVVVHDRDFRRGSRQQVLLDVGNRHLTIGLEQPGGNEPIEIAARPVVNGVVRNRTFADGDRQSVEHLLGQIDHRNEQGRTRLVRHPEIVRLDVRELFRQHGTRLADSDDPLAGTLHQLDEVARIAEFLLPFGAQVAELRDVAA